MRKLLPILLIGVILTLGIVLRLAFLEIHRRTPDENFYTTYAREIASHGKNATIDLVSAYNFDPTNWVYPPPTRIGYTYLLAWFMKITGRTDGWVGSRVSAGFSILALIILIVIGLKFFNPWITSIALLFLSVSPMDLAIARRTWQDSVMSFLSAALLLLAAEISARPKNRALLFLFTFTGSYCLLVKESGAIVFAFCTVWILWSFIFKWKDYIGALFLFLLCVVGAEAASLALKWTTGDLRAVWELWEHVKTSMAANLYATANQEASWVDFLKGFWFLSPLTVVFLAAGLIFSILKRKEVPFALACFIATIFCFLTLFHFFKNIRYASVLYVPYCLMAGYGFWASADFVQGQLKNAFIKSTALAALGLILTCSSFMDYLNFERLFLDKRLQDLTGKNIVSYSIYSKPGTVKN